MNFKMTSEKPREARYRIKTHGNRKHLVTVAFYGDKRELHALIADGILRPKRIGRKIIFSLADIRVFAERASKLQGFLKEAVEQLQRFD